MKAEAGVEQARVHACSGLGVFQVKKFGGQFGRTVIRPDPAQVTALRAAGAVRQLPGQLGKAVRMNRLVREFQQGPLGMHRQRLNIDAGRDGKQDVPQMQRLPHHELRLMRLVIALTFAFGWLGRDDILVHHGLDDFSLVLAQFGRCQRFQTCRARQQTP